MKNLESPIEEMIFALEENINYLKNVGNSHIKLKNGNYLRSNQDVHIYNFELEFLQNIDVDIDVEVRVKGSSSSGKVISIKENIITLGVDKYLGDDVDEANLVITNYYLLQLLKDKLADVKNGNQNLSDLSKKAFNFESFLIGNTNYSVPSSSITDAPNESQEKAIKLSMGSEVSYIWGPPGTGKTQTISRIIEGLLDSNNSVLLISHTNVATDGALLSVVKHLQTTEDYLEGRFLREGVISKDELKEFEYVDPSIVLEHKAKPIIDELEEIDSKIKSLEVRIEEYRVKIEKFKTIKILNDQIEDLNSKLSQIRSDIKKVEDEHYKNKTEIENIENKIKKFEKKGKLGKFFSTLNLDKLSKDKSIHIKERDKKYNLIAANKKLSEKTLSEINSLKSRKNDIEIELRGDDFQKVQKNFENDQIKIQEFDERRTNLIKEKDQLEEKIYREAKVIATTLTKSYISKIVMSREYDCVIIDEASMAPLPALWYASGLAQKKVVIIGDFYQLPPILNYKPTKQKSESNEDLEYKKKIVNKWMKKDIFEVSGAISEIESGNKPQWLEQLKVQYRMHPEIASVINHLVYAKNGRQFSLDSAESTQNNGFVLINSEPLKGYHLGLYDTSDIGAYSSRTDSGSYYNIYNAILAVKIAEDALSNGYEDIGIISPFRAQVNLINRIIQDKDLKNLLADTVHRFQGAEKQLIIFDTTTPNPTQLTDDKAAGGDDEKLLNVAFSRAKEKLIVIADINAIQKKHSNSSLLKKFIEYYNDKNYPHISTINLLSYYDVNQQEEVWLKKINNIQDIENEISNSILHDDRDFYLSFSADLLNAKKEVIIDSPFITRRRVNRIFPIINQLITKNINIFVFTRIPSEHNDLMRVESERVINEFEEMGIKVLPFKGHLHRKLALIDRKILWEGSLNILSQWNSQEIMRRFEGENTCIQTMKFLNWDKNIGEIGENNLIKCEFCDEVGAYYWTGKGMYGEWTYCIIGNHRPGKKPKSKSEKKKIKKEISKLSKADKQLTNKGEPICPVHNIPMIKREGRFGEFWGCQKYPRCKITHNIN